jgi:hypothetical protein
MDITVASEGRMRRYLKVEDMGELVQRVSLRSLGLWRYNM